MASLSPDAQSILEQYLQRVRASLHGHTSVDVDDVERDVHGHVHAALAGQPEPVDARSIHDVLTQLGAPEQWVPADDLPTWHQALGRWSGPGDWRLPAVALLCFLLGPLLFFVPVENADGTAAGPLLWPLPVVLLVLSFVLARASTAVLTAAGASVATRRWLLYPPLVFWYVPGAVVLLAWPAAFTLAAINDFEAVRSRLLALPFSAPLDTAVACALGLGMWWVLFGGITARYPQLIKVAFWPFAEWFGRRSAFGILAAGVTLLAITVALVVLA
jgi:hypothetical protein